MYSMFDKRYVYFMPCGALAGCRVFYGDSIADIVSDVESGEMDRMGLLAGCASGDNDEYPFKFSESEWRFVYHDPWYAEKLAFRRGAAVEYMDNTGKWHDADEEPDWTVYNNYRVKTSNWHYVGMDYTITDSAPPLWRFRGTLRQCVEWCAKRMERKMKLAIHNDGKEKSQSWQVSLGDSYEELLYMPTFDFSNITGYGATKQEAIDEFKKDFKASVENVMKIIDELNENNFEEIMVDCFGNPIKER